MTDVDALNESEFIGINRLSISKAYPHKRDAHLQCENLSVVEAAYEWWEHRYMF